MFYERLPNFCLFCGVIGHQETTCDLSENLRRRRYTCDLGVQAMYNDDLRRWHLAESAGQSGRALHMALPWRMVPTVGAKPPSHAIIAQVAKEVAKLTVKEVTQKDTDGTTTAEKTESSQAISSTPRPLDRDLSTNSSDNAGMIDTNSKAKHDNNKTTNPVEDVEEASEEQGPGEETGR